MTLEQLLESLPDYAKDTKLNVKALILNSTTLTLKQTAIIALATAVATKNKTLIDAVAAQFENVLSQTETNAAKAAAVIMGMNNVYYRFLHLAANKEYEKMPAGLRMNIISNHGIEVKDFEFASIAVSAINGCGLCIDSHEKTLKKHGATVAEIQQAVKIAGVVNAVATALTLV